MLNKQRIMVLILTVVAALTGLLLPASATKAAYGGQITSYQFTHPPLIRVCSLKVTYTIPLGSPFVDSHSISIRNASTPQVYTRSVCHSGVGQFTASFNLVLPYPTDQIVIMLDDCGNANQIDGVTADLQRVCS